MRIVLLLSLLLMSAALAGQDTVRKTRLVPFRGFAGPYLTRLEQGLSVHEQRFDSLPDSDSCKRVVAEYLKICRATIKRIRSAEVELYTLNDENRHSGYCFYLVIERRERDFDWRGCGPAGSGSEEDCIDINLRIERKEKSGLILDGPSGSVFYREEIRRMPK